MLFQSSEFIIFIQCLTSNKGPVHHTNVCHHQKQHCFEVGQNSLNPIPLRLTKYDHSFMTLSSIVNNPCS